MAAHAVASQLSPAMFNYSVPAALRELPAHEDTHSFSQSAWGRGSCASEQFAKHEGLEDDLYFIEMYFFYL